jgi:hypothetical protein
VIRYHRPVRKIRPTIRPSLYADPIRLNTSFLSSIALDNSALTVHSASQAVLLYAEGRLRIFHSKQLRSSSSPKQSQGDDSYGNSTAN